VSLKKTTFDQIFEDPKYGTFTSFQVVKLLNIKKERLQEWLYKGFIKPEVRASGRGTKNRFSFKNLYEIALFSYLLKKGVSRKEGSKILKTGVLDTLERFKKTTMKSVKSDLPFKSIKPVLIIYKTGEKYSSETIFDKKIGFEIQPDIIHRNIDEVQIINISKIIKAVDNAVRKMS